jgi:hypothetical protein
MPDSAGKRQRREVKAKKAAAIEERRLARTKRREDRAAGVVEAGAPIAPNEDDGSEAFAPPASGDAPATPAGP